MDRPVVSPPEFSSRGLADLPPSPTGDPPLLELLALSGPIPGDGRALWVSPGPPDLFESAYGAFPSPSRALGQSPKALSPHRVQLSYRVCSRPQPPGQGLTLLGSCSLRHDSDERARSRPGLPPRSVPLPGFDYPLSGVLPARPTAGISRRSALGILPSEPFPLGERKLLSELAALLTFQVLSPISSEDEMAKRLTVFRASFPPRIRHR